MHGITSDELEAECQSKNWTRKHVEFWTWSMKGYRGSVCWYAKEPIQEGKLRTYHYQVIASILTIHRSGFV